MRQEPELIEKIEYYLEGRLPAAELMTFEKQIANNPGLSNLGFVADRSDHCCHAYWEDRCTPPSN